MKKSILGLLIVGSLLSLSAQTNVVRRMTPELREKIRLAKLRNTGGNVRQAKSAKGVFAFLNSQTRVPLKEIRAVEPTLDRGLRIQMSFADVPGLGLANAAEAVAKARAAGGVVIVDDPSLPMLVTAPEAGWSVVNVAKLAEGAPDAETLHARVRKEVLRAFAFVTGGAYLSQADPLMRDVVRPRDLDLLPEGPFGIEFAMAFKQSARTYGFKPWYETTYLQACEEGWAPAPTNEYQKAIWEKTHTLPAAPLKLEK